MEDERLHVKKPKGGGKQCANGKREEFSRAQVIEPGKDREGERGEITSEAEHGDGDSRNLGISAREHFGTASLSPAGRGFTGQRQDREISRVGKAKQAKQGRETVENHAAA